MPNDMRDRLRDLIWEADRKWLSNMLDETSPSGYTADHLIANGVILPPCKVGDKIYMLVTRHTTSFEFPNGKMVRKENQHTIIKQTYLTKSNFFKVLEDFGKTVFLTKEEAEAKLKEMQK